MRLTIEHSTHYHYDTQVRHSTQYLRLTPASTSRQHILAWELDLPELATETTDGFGNITHVLSLDHPRGDIEIRAHGVVEISENVAEESEDTLSPLVYLRQTPLTKPSAAIRQFANDFRTEEPLVGLRAMMAALLEKMSLTDECMTVAPSAEEAFARGAGVYQDSNHVFLSCCRHLGIPARYISGYLYSPNNRQVITHGWTEAWVDSSWHTFDVSNQTGCPNQHLKLAVGMDYLDACPIRGVLYDGKLPAEAPSTVRLVDISSQQ